MLIGLLRCLLRILFGFRAFNTEVLRTPGPVLLIPNHVSWIDWLFVAVCLEKDWRFVTSKRMAETESWWKRKIIDNHRTFPVDPTSPYAVRHMAEYLQHRGRLVLFAEGRLSRTGTLMKLYDGTGFLLHKTDAQVITCYLRGAPRLPFSPNREAKRWFPRVTAHFSAVSRPPHLENLSTSKARAQLTGWLRDKLVLQQFETEMAFGPTSLPAAVWGTLGAWPKKVVLEDIVQPLTGRQLQVAAALLAEELEPLLTGSAARVGVLLPNVNGMPAVLLSLWLRGRVPALLNYSTGSATMVACVQLAGLTHVITSRAFLEKARLNLAPVEQAGARLIYLEDVRARVGRGKKFFGWLRASSGAVQPPPVDPKLTAVVLFTSGSEGVPKGVELSHTNVLANVRQMLAVCDLQDHDRVFNALPLFHSFGLTVGTLLPLIRGLKVYLYPSPLHYRVIPTAFYEWDCTIMLGTNTFLNGYARKANPYDFRSLRYMFAGAEKLQDATATVWAQRFGVRIFEGYGATECSPCVAVATPLAAKHGTAGRLMPGIECRFEPVEGVQDAGRLQVRGPNIMRGYLNVEANAAFQSLGGWYDTGDIARLDEEGFLSILGRLKRFAKVSGEMVSLTAVEEALAGAFPQYGLRCQIAIISRPDADKGEILLAVSNEPRLKIEEVRAHLRARGFPNICAPRELRVVREIPKLGTGKVNHRELEKLL